MPEPVDVGKNANIFVVISTGGILLQLTPSGLLFFDGTVEGLVAFDQIVLAATNPVDLLAVFGGAVTLTAGEAGSYLIFVGYSIVDGTITFNN